MEVRLSASQPEHRAALEGLQLAPGQAEFTAHPADLLPEVSGQPRRLPVTILADDEPVGLFVLSVGEHRDQYLPAGQTDPNGVALGALSVDARWQKKGVGTEALRRLPDFVPAHFPEARHVLLVVNQRNPGARRVYERAGFSVVRERLGRKGLQWVMTRSL